MTPSRALKRPTHSPSAPTATRLGGQRASRRRPTQCWCSCGESIEYPRERQPEQWWCQRFPANSLKGDQAARRLASHFAPNAQSGSIATSGHPSARRTTLPWSLLVGPQQVDNASNQRGGLLVRVLGPRKPEQPVHAPRHHCARGRSCSRANGVSVGVSSQSCSTQDREPTSLSKNCRWASSRFSFSTRL